MKNTKTKVLIVAQLLIMGVVMWLSPFLNVSCASNPIITISGITGTDSTRLNSLVGDINSRVRDEADINWDFLAIIPTTSSDIYSIELNMLLYKECEIDTKQKIMESALSAVSNSNLSLTNRNKLYNFIANEDTTTSSLVRQLSKDVNADFGNAYYKYFKPWSGALGILLGCISLAIFVTLAVVTVIDIAYICIPIVQIALSHDNSTSKPKLVSLEAANAIKDGESASGNTRKDVMMIYLKSKTKQYVALAICLLYLISGNIYNLLANFIDYFTVMID